MEGVFFLEREDTNVISAADQITNFQNTFDGVRQELKDNPHLAYELDRLNDV